VKTARLWAIVCLVLLIVAGPAIQASALAEGWGLPSWKANASKNKASEGNWSVSGKKPSSSNFASSTRKQPSTWQKMTSGTSTAMKKTTSALTPWKSKPAPPTRMTGARPAKKTAPTSTWYNPTTWFAEETKPASKPAGSVSEFLNQPRVPY
jgi:hypothetical protein